MVPLVIKNKRNTDLISLQVYNPSYFNSFNPAAKFEKWAAVEVEGLDAIPDGMETCWGSD